MTGLQGWFCGYRFRHSEFHHFTPLDRPSHAWPAPSPSSRVLALRRNHHLGSFFQSPIWEGKHLSTWRDTLIPSLQGWISSSCGIAVETKMSLHLLQTTASERRTCHWSRGACHSSPKNLSILILVKHFPHQPKNNKTTKSRHPSIHLYFVNYVWLPNAQHSPIDTMRIRYRHVKIRHSLCSGHQRSCHGRYFVLPSLAPHIWSFQLLILSKTVSPCSG